MFKTCQNAFKWVWNTDKLCIKTTLGNKIRSGGKSTILILTLLHATSIKITDHTRNKLESNVTVRFTLQLLTKMKYAV